MRRRGLTSVPAGCLVGGWAGRLLLGLSAASAAPALALDPAKAITQYRQRTWQVEDGLPQISVLAITQSPSGHLWLGTQDGLARFDGDRFTVFEKDNTPALRRNYVLALLAARDESVWIGTYGGGLTRFKDGRFRAYTKDDGLPDEIVFALCEDRSGALWIGTARGGVARLFGERFVTYTKQHGLPDDKVLAVTEASDGTMWFGTHGGLARFADGAFTVFGRRDGLPQGPVTAIHEDREGRLWFGTRAGLARLEGERFVVYTSRDGLADDSVLSLAEDRDGSLWIGTTAGGLSRFAAGRFASYGTTQGLPDGHVYAIYEDREGSLWIGTLTGGLAQLVDTPFTPYGRPEGLSNDLVRSVLEDRDGRLWVGTGEGGLNLFDGGRFATFALGVPAGRHVKALMHDRAGNLWAGTIGGGLVRIAPDGRKKVYTTRDGLTSDNALALAEDPAGNVWVGTGGGGLVRFRDGHFERLTPEDGLPSDGVLALDLDPEGKLWAGTYGGGLLLFDGARFVRYTARDGLSDDVVQVLHRDAEGSLWIGTNGGLTRLRSGEFTRYGRADGLADDVVLQILDDGRGHLWLGGSKGLSRLRKKDLDDFDAGRLRALSPLTYGVAADGMRSRDCTSGHPAAWKASDGTLWFSTVKGLVAVDLSRLDAPQPPPPAIVAELRVDGRPLAPGAEAPPGRGDLEIRYAALSLVAPESLRFRYRLEGYDDVWVEAGARRVAYYTGIPPGRYSFRVVAAARRGEWGTAGDAVTLRLRPRFYQTWWFAALAAASVALGVVQAHRVRLRLLAAEAAVLAERNRMAREIHDTLAQSLAGIGLRLDIARRALPRTRAEAEEAIEAAASLSRVALIEARRSVAVLGADGREGDLASTLAQLARAVTEGAGVSARTVVQGLPGPLAAALETDLLRVAQEALSNAIRHARAREVAVELSCEDGWLALRVTDDGCGFDVASAAPPAGAGYGLPGMRARASARGGRLELFSRPGHGTEVVLRLPLRQERARAGLWRRALGRWGRDAS